MTKMSEQQKYTQGAIFRHIEDPTIFARIEKVTRVGQRILTVQFSVWGQKGVDGWAGGAGDTLENFKLIYPKGPWGSIGAAVRATAKETKPTVMKIRITGVFEYEVDRVTARENYNTTDPAKILEMDGDSMGDIFLEELMNGDKVKLSIEIVDE